MQKVRSLQIFFAKDFGNYNKHSGIEEKKNEQINLMY